MLPAEEVCCGKRLVVKDGSPPPVWFHRGHYAVVPVPPVRGFEALGQLLPGPTRDTCSLTGSGESGHGGDIALGTLGRGGGETEGGGLSGSWGALAPKGGASST